VIPRLLFAILDTATCWPRVLKTVREGTSRGSCGYLLPLHIVVSNHKTDVKSLRSRGLPHPASTINRYSIVSHPRSNSLTKAPVSRYVSMGVNLSIFGRATAAVPKVSCPAIQGNEELIILRAAAWENSRDHFANDKERLHFVISFGDRRLHHTQQDLSHPSNQKRPHLNPPHVSAPRTPIPCWQCKLMNRECL